MAYYRLYFITGPAGHIEQFREFDADSDSAAVALAESWHGTLAMELWSRSRKVKRWDAEAHATTSPQP